MFSGDRERVNFFLGKKWLSFFIYLFFVVIELYLTLLTYLLTIFQINAWFEYCF